MKALTFTLCLMLAIISTGCFPTSSGSTTDGSTDGSTGGTGGDETCTPTTNEPTDADVEELIKTGDAVPGQGGANFTFFGPPIIDPNGRIAFWAGYENGEGDAGIFVWNGTEIVQILSDDPQTAGIVPGRNNAEYFGDVNITATGGEYPMVWGTNGRLIFVAPISGDRASRGIFRWRASDGDIIRVTDLELQEDEYSDAVVGTFSTEFTSPTISDNGIVGYAFEYTYITANNTFVLNQGATYASNGVSLTRIADSNPTQLTLVPDRPESALFTQIGPLISNNPAGAILLQGSYTPQTDGDSRGVYLFAGGELFRVIDNRPAASWEGLASDGTVNPDGQEYEAIAIGEDLRIAIDSTFSTGSSTRDTVIHWNGATWRELSGDGQFATDLLSGVNSCGQVFILAGGFPFRTNGATTDRIIDDLPTNLQGSDTTWLTSGAAINNQGRGLLLFQRSGNGATSMVYFTGSDSVLIVDSLDGILADVDDVATIAAPELDRPGRSSVINDADEFTFLAIRNGNDGEAGSEDDQQTIYVATPVR
jgi:hypothetical protein